MPKLKQFAIAHKLITALMLAAAAWGAYVSYGAATKPAAVTKYVIQTAAEGTVIASVSGSGQVQAATTVDVKPQISEPVTRIAVQVGERVTAGQLLIELDTTNEIKAVKQAQLGLQSAQLALAKLQEAPAATTLGQDQDAITQEQELLANASTTLAKDYQNGFDATGAAFVDFQNIMTALNDFTAGTEVDKLHANPDAYVNLMPNYLQPATVPYATAVGSVYAAAVAAYQQNLADYHAANRNAAPSTLDALFAETENTAKTISESVKADKDMLNYMVNHYPSGQGLAALPAITTTFQTNFGDYTATINNDVTNVAATQGTIVSDKNSLSDDALALREKQDVLAALQAGPDTIDVQSQGITIQNAQIALQNAEQNLAYDSIRAPIDGIVSSIPSVIGTTVASPAVSIVGDGKLAQITLNEVDAAKVTLGDKAALTFDAIAGLSLAGKVVELDPVGTVSQGVVNYNAQINFSQPADISSSATVKPGMSVTANIVVRADQNVIALPNGAVHTLSGTSYVLEPASQLSAADVAASQNGGIALAAGAAGGSGAAPGTKMVPVTMGISNDTQTEITSGVSVGDQIITQTIAGGTSAGGAASTGAGGGTNVLRALGGGGFGGGGGGGGGR